MSELEKYRKVFLSRDPKLDFFIVSTDEWDINMMDRYGIILSYFNDAYPNSYLYYKNYFLLNLWIFDFHGREDLYNKLIGAWSSFKDYEQYG